MNENLSFFGAIAVSMGLVSEEDLAKIIVLQEKLSIQGEKKRIGDLLCEAGHLTSTDVDIVLAMQQTYDIVTEETRFGELAVVNGLLTQQDIDEALNKQKESGGDRTVGDILVDMGLISTFQMNAILQSQERLRAIFDAQSA